ncbi:MAG: hypothetical protein JHD02_02780 [Thermoleophilaceae bacterium]|nr:hypothetical protein [Thermoleophilaceae bacterium]
MIAHVSTKKTSRRTPARFLALAGAILTLGSVLTGSASAELDNFTTGDGHEGAVTVTSNSVLNYSAPLSSAAAAGATSVTTGVGQTGAIGGASTTGSPAQTQFEANRLALVIQTSNFIGAGAASGSQADINLSSSSTGQWELARISSVTGSIAAGMTVNFASPLINSYAASGAQIVAVPEFTNVQINNTRSWSANSWNGTNGGITAFLATGTVNLKNGSSSINANGDGFRGGLTYNGTASGCTQLDGPVGGGKGEGIVAGVYPGNATSYASRGNIANGGGGGVCQNSGGGGGGNGGQGGIGGFSFDGSRNVGGLGGTKLIYSAIDHAIFGGGGGAGDENNDSAGNGGNGGGFVFVRANALVGSGSIAATGNPGGDSANVGASDAGGGGGAGGVVYARFNTTASCASVSVRGGDGGDELSTGGVHGPGGGGAGGRLLLQSSGGNCQATVGSGVAGTVTSGGGTRGASPSSSNDAVSSGAAESVPGGGGLLTPTAGLSSPADNAYTNDATPTITGTSSMNGGTIRVSIDGVHAGSTSTGADGSWSFTPDTPLTAGSHTYAARPVFYGLAGRSTAVRSLNIDLTAPDAPYVSSSRSGSVSATTATITYSPAEPGGALQCSVDGGVFETCAASPVNLSSLADGNHSYAVLQVDAAGNVGSISSVAWVVDTVAPPAPSVSADRSGTTSETNAEVGFSAGEPGGTLECSLDGAAFTSCPGSPVSLSGLTDGPHSYSVRQLDDGGNVGSPTGVSWDVDTVAPETPTVSSSRNGTVNESTATISFSASESGGTLECSLDGATFAACSPSPVELSGLTDGPHSYSVRQLDVAGNTATAGTVAWIVDLTAPSPPMITTPATTPTYSALAQPEIAGVAEPGGAVRIHDGAVPVGFGTVDGNGRWTIATDTLSDGAHTITATVGDSAGNTSGVSEPVTLVVDTTAPTVAISAPVDGEPVITPEVVVNFSVLDENPGADSLCGVDGGSLVSCTSGFTTSVLTAGAHTITVQHVDRAGNTGSSSASFTLANSTPQVFITSPTDLAHVASATPSVEFNIVDDNPNASSLCSLDDGPATACVSPYRPSALGDGSHTVTVSHTDTGGKIGDAAVTFTVDTTAPGAANITDAPGTPLASDEATFAFSGDEIDGYFSCSLDGAAAAPCPSQINYTGLAEGPHDFAVRQVDRAGNTGPSDTHSWTVDTTPPAAPSVTGPNPLTNNRESTVSFNASGDTVSMFCSLDGGSFTACLTSPLSLGDLPDGSHSFTVQARDSAGNSSSTSVTWVVDTGAPGAPTITSGPVGATPSRAASFAFTGTENGGLYRCQLDSQPAVTCSSPFEYAGLADETYTFRVRQIDAAGNVGPSTSRTWTVDTTPPSAPVVTGPTSPSGLTSALLDIHVAQTGLTFQCRLDGGAYAPCANPLRLDGLVDGLHTVSVRAYDAAGNGSAAGSYSWTLDRSLFTADISGAPTGAVNETAATLTLSSSRPGSTFECSLDGAAFAACTTAVTLVGLAEGPHNFRTRATSGAQVSPQVTRSWAVDLTNPTVSISAPASASTTGPKTSVIFTTGDINAPITTTCRLDNAAAAPCSSPNAYSDLPAGRHTVLVVAADAAGNSASAVVTWQVDRTAPSAPVINQPSADGATRDATPTIGGSAEANSTVILYEGEVEVAMLSADISGSWSWTPNSDYADGLYEFSARSIDQFDNESVSSATRRIAIDNAAPAAPKITAPVDGPTNDPTPLVTGTAEPGSQVTVFVDGGPVPGSATVDGSGSWEKRVSPALLDGTHTITAVAIDDAANESPLSVGVATAVDTSPPSVSIISPTSASSQGIAFTAETGAAARCRIDSGAFVACTSPYATSGLTDGSHTITVEVTDSAGNVATAAATFTVDLTGPTAQLTGGPADGADSSDPEPTFSFTSDEPGDFECSIDGGAFAVCTSPFTLPALGDGAHTFRVRAIDQAGNASAELSRNWSVDTKAPDAPVIDSPVDNSDLQDNTPTVGGHAASAEAGAALSVYVNGTLHSATTVNPDGSWSLLIAPALSDNTYVFTARATDAAGNQSEPGTSVTVRVDASAPTAEITAGPGARTNDSTQTFSFAADEPGSFECRVDSGEFAPCTSPLTTAVLLDGSHQFAVRALDRSGNISAPETWDWMIDTTAPVVTVISNTPNAGLSPTFSFSSSEPGTTYRCRIDGSVVLEACGSPFTPPTLAPGSHTFELQFTDPAGNTGVETINFSVSAPTDTTCSGNGDEPGIPADITMLGASADKNVVNFTINSDKFILVRVSIHSGKKRIGTAVRANDPGRRIVAIRTKTTLPRNTTYAVRLAAITMSGGKSVIDTDMVTDKSGRTTLVGRDGEVGASPVSVVDCAPESDAKKIRVRVTAPVRLKIGAGKVTAAATASDWAVATLRVIQYDKTVGRRVVLLRPGLKMRSTIKLLEGRTLARGRAGVQVTTCSVDGVWQHFTKRIAVR